MSDEKPDMAEKTVSRLTPGYEAEQLRAGIEKLIGEAEYASELDDREAVPAYDLQKLLDDVDARDSLAYLEEREDEHHCLGCESCEMLEAWVDYEDAWDEFNEWKDNEWEPPKPEIEKVCACGHGFNSHDHNDPARKCRIAQTDTTTNYKTVKCACSGFEEDKDAQ